MTLKTKCKHVLLISFLTIAVSSLSLLVEAKDFESYKFGNIQVTSIPPIKTLSYKEIRSREICEMAQSYGFSKSDCSLIVAHAVTECGSMDEFCGWTEGSYRSDAGLAIGLFQFHLCYRYADWMKENKFGCPHGQPRKVSRIRDQFYKDFPEMKTWRGQVTKYLTEQKECVQTRSLLSCIDRWNAHPAYVSRVKSRVPVANSLLGV